MLLVLHKHFALIKEKLDNERMEQSSFKLKKDIILLHHELHDRTDEKLSARDGWYKIMVIELGKLSNLIIS